jgi:hypothetical protein
MIDTNSISLRSTTNQKVRGSSPFGCTTCETGGSLKGFLLIDSEIFVSLTSQNLTLGLVTFGAILLMG